MKLKKGDDYYSSARDERALRSILYRIRGQVHYIALQNLSASEVQKLLKLRSDNNKLRLMSS